MSVRPPTLREKRRYLLARIEPCGVPLEAKDLYYTIHEAATSLWGDVVVAAMQPAVIALEEGYAILRCRRGTERECAIALSTITACRDYQIALRIIAASGTIDSLRDRIHAMGAYAPQHRESEMDANEEFTFDTRTFEVVHCDGHKLDVIEKGFKNTNRLFLTTEDLEEK
jgi:ribonuclease P/MRP protein subunit POP5